MVSYDRTTDGSGIPTSMKYLKDDREQNCKLIAEIAKTKCFRTCHKGGKFMLEHLIMDLKGKTAERAKGYAKLIQTLTSTGVQPMFGNNLWNFIYDMKPKWVNFRKDLISNFLKTLSREEFSYYTKKGITKKVYISIHNSNFVGNGYF